MTGPIALHGGGEFLPGDERFLLALVERAAAAGDGAPVRAVVVPAAAAGQRPELAGRHGVESIERVARAADIRVSVEIALVVDAESAADPPLVARLADANLVHLPGGDPALVPAILAGTSAWRAIVGAHGRGAVVAGASAGAMALARTTWTPQGFVDGLGLVDGLVVVPHFETFDPTGREADVEHVQRQRLAGLGLDERTGVIREAAGRWRVVGQGRAVWIPADGEPVVAVDGEMLPIEG